MQATHWSIASNPLQNAQREAGVMAGLGGFGGLFDLKAAGFNDPILSRPPMVLAPNCASRLIRAF
jgi:hypothetical protein